MGGRVIMCACYLRCSSARGSAAPGLLLGCWHAPTRCALAAWSSRQRQRQRRAALLRPSPCLPAPAPRQVPDIKFESLAIRFMDIRKR